MSWTFTTYGRPEDPAQMVDHLELSFKPLMRLAEIAEYVEHHQGMPDRYREAIRDMALDAPTVDGLFAFGDLLEVARNTAGELADEAWRERNPEKAAEADALTAENGNGDGSEPGLSSLEDTVLTLARIAALSAKQPEGGLAERVLGEVNVMAEDQFRRYEDALADLEEGFDVSERTHRWATSRLEELADDVVGGGEGPGARDAPSAGDVPVERLFDVLNVARGCLELAADGELENSYGVSPRTMFRAVCEYLRPAYDDALEALGRDPDEDEVLATANNTLAALAREEEGHNLPSDVVDALALGERATLDLAPARLHGEAEQVVMEMQSVRVQVEDRLGLDGEESDARINEARERFERLMEGGGDGE